MVDTKGELSIAAQCSLLGIHRSGWYREPRRESQLNLRLMRLMDEKYLQCPFYGVPRMYTWLRMDKGFEVNYKRVERLYKQMGLRALLPAPDTSRRHPSSYTYPYLLRGLEITTCNQVWSADITYIPMKAGYMYLFALMDVYSRYVVGWDVSSSMDASWCTAVLQQACKKHGRPKILNTDQGSQFTSDEWINALKKRKIAISMDGKGRAIDNIFIERFWWSLKHEHVYSNPADDGLDLFAGLRKYIHFYHVERRHGNLNKLTPSMVYQQKMTFPQKEKRSKKEKLKYYNSLS